MNNGLALQRPLIMAHMIISLALKGTVVAVASNAKHEFSNLPRKA